MAENREKIGKFAAEEKIFRCPVCRGKLKIRENGSLVCKKKHCFDVSSKGYVNFISGRGVQSNLYDKELFECRNRIFQEGFYHPFLEELEACIKKWAPVRDEGGTARRTQEPDRGKEEMGKRSSVRILDVGCGEGYYANELSRRIPQAEFFGVDLVKEAIRMACKGGPHVKWMVANLADLPLFNGTFDVVLNILTPANYNEFQRVMKKDGILVKAVPGSDYLNEIRRCVSHKLIRKSYENQAVVDYFTEHMELKERRRVCYQLPVAEETARLFLRMTPMTFHIDTEEIPREQVRQIREVTIDLEILVGERKK